MTDEPAETVPSLRTLKSAEPAELKISNPYAVVFVVEPTTSKLAFEAGVDVPTLRLFAVPAASVPYPFGGVCVGPLKATAWK